MRSGFNRLRSGVAVALLTILVAQVAAARGLREEPGWWQRFERAKRFIVTVLGRFSIPPGEPIDGTTSQAPSGSDVAVQE